MKLPLLTSLLLATASLLPAQIDRESTADVDYRHLRNTTLAEIQTWTAQGYRISNVEINQPPPNLTLHCSLVRNTGVYAASWLFYYDKTRAELLNLCSQNNARIVDLERYEISGQERLAALLFVNTGAQHKAWTWHTGLLPGSVYSTVSGLGMRVIDLEPYTENGQRRYHAISIANSGTDQKAWWVYTNTQPNLVQGYMDQHGARLYDYELESALPTRGCAVLVRDHLKSLTLWGNGYWQGFDDDIENGGRVVGLGRDSLTGRAITLLDNLDPFTTGGISCSGTQGPTVISATGSGFTGTSVTYRCGGLRPWAPAFVAYGFLAQTVSLGNLGAPWCYANLVPATTALRFANGSGVATDVLPIPVDPGLVGLPLLTQFIGSDPGNNSLGLQASRRLQTRIRHW